MKNKASGHLFLLAGLLCLLSSWAVACGRPALSLPSPAPSPGHTQAAVGRLPLAPIESLPPAQPPPVDKAANGEDWNTVETFTGRGNETTSAFHISGIKWRITWTADAADYPECAVFDLFVYPEGTHSMFTERISRSGGSVSETTYIYEGGWDYYIKVIAANLRSWTITVEDYATKVKNPISPVQIIDIHYEGTTYPPEPEECVCLERAQPNEYVVIKNLGDSHQEIGGWVLRNITKGYPSFTFPPYTLAPSETVVVYTDEFHWTLQQLESPWADYVQTRYDAQQKDGRSWPSSIPFPDEPGGFTFCYGPGDIWDNEEPDVAVLYNAEGEEVSRKSYRLPTESPPCPVQITHIHYKGALYLLESQEGLYSERVEIDEYVEVMNLGDYSQGIGGWVLKNITKGYPSFTFSVGLALYPGEIIRIYTHRVHPEFVYRDAFHTRRGGLSFYYSPGDIWDNEEPDVAVLYNAQGEEVSRKSYRVPTQNEIPGGE